MYTCMKNYIRYSYFFYILNLIFRCRIILIFRYRVIWCRVILDFRLSGRVGSGIKLSRGKSFRILGRIRSSRVLNHLVSGHFWILGRIRYRVIWCWIILNLKSYRMWTGWTDLSDPILPPLAFMRLTNIKVYFILNRC
jgi:hypothetical protein